ncbi:MAG: hypothetical protein ABI873_12865 [Marmoricola sp.]
MTSPNRRPRVRRGSLIAGGVALLTLTGCGALHPGVAVQIGDTSISRDQVDALSRIQCDLSKGRPSGSQPRARMVQATVNILIETAIDNMYGASVGATYDRSALQTQVQQFKTGVAKLPPKDRDAITAAFTDYARGRLVIESAGQRKLKAQGQQNPGTDEAINEGSRLAGRWAKKLDIQVDPRYNPGKSNQAGGGDGSISRPVSRYSKASAGTGSPAFVASLPTGLRCG